MSPSEASRSAAVPLHPEGIPQELGALPHWVAWRWVENGKDPGGKPRKLPINPATGAAAKINDSSTWTSLEAAVAFNAQHGGPGVMFAITAECPYTGVDIDKCRETQSGEITPDAQAIVADLASYTEVSPSGTGLHVFCRGKLPNGRRRQGQLEMYDDGRFLVFTGAHLPGAPTAIEERSEQLAALHARTFPKAKTSKLTGHGTDEQVLKRIAAGRDAEAFARLWEGDWSPRESQSQGDLALCRIIAKACANDAVTIDRLFRRSRLIRPKWDEKRGERTYGAMTIAEATKGSRRKDPKIRGEASVCVEGGDLRLVLVHHKGRERSKVKAILPDGQEFIDKVDLGSMASRRTYSGRIHERFPEILEEAIEEGLGELAAYLMAATGDAPDPTRDDRDDRDDDDPTSSIADALVSLVVGAPGVDLFHTPGRHEPEAFATVSLRGRRETLSISSGAFKHWLVGTYRSERGGVPNATALQNALLVIESEAIHSDAEHEVHIRVALDGESVWLDLCDDDRNAVHITAEGWSVVPHDRVKVRFVRRRGMHPLPVPVRGGSVDELRPMVNLADDAAWVLFVSVLVAYLRPSGPFPVLIASGEQGSAKSYLCRIVRSLVDPSLVPLRRPPKEDRDLMIAAKNAWVVGYDNISRLSEGLSDSLCTLATRGGFGARALFTNDEEKLFDVMRPVVINGIGDIATRADLLDRAVILMLPSIPPDKRVSEKVMDRRVAAVLPRVLGALLDGAVAALRNVANVQLPILPRMADFATWATAAEEGFGWAPGAFMDAYTGTLLEADTIAIEGSLVGMALIEFMSNRDTWTGTATQLRTALEEIVPEKDRSKNPLWPKQSNSFSNEVQRIATVLRRRGIETHVGRRPGGSRRRYVHIEKKEVGQGSSLIVPVVPGGDDGPADAAGKVQPRDDSMFDAADFVGEDRPGDDGDGRDDLYPSSVLSTPSAVPDRDTAGDDEEVV